MRASFSHFGRRLLERHALLFVVAALLAPIALRLVQISERGTSGWQDGLGFLSDIAVCLIVAGLLAVSARLSRWLCLPLSLAWSLANYANYEHFTVLGSSINLFFAKYLGNKTFILGSAIHPSRPILLVLLAALSITVTWFACRRTVNIRPLSGLLIGGVIGLVIMVVTVGSSASWRTAHVLHENLYWMATSEELDPSARGIPGVYPKDLDGAPVIELGRERHNVLLVLLESVSGVYFDSVAQKHNTKARYRPAFLSRWLDRYISVDTFIIHQRQTNRGEYAILCGDLPRLVTGTAKMSEIGGLTSEQLRGSCLPGVLREHGYNTVYLQSAPLTFMSKDRFMPLAGFERVLGSGSIENAHRRGEWGVDDQTLFERSLRLIQELEADGKPWFVTLLNVGTHHPYIVPSHFRGRHRSGKPRAIEFMDSTVGTLLDSLEQRGILDDTLVVITTDESNEKSKGAAESLLSHGWGFLVARTPEQTKHVIDEPFAQIDIATSILDYLGMSDKDTFMGGRSIFRRYDRPRWLPLSNFYHHRVAALTPDDDLLICTENFARCAVHDREPGKLFAPLDGTPSRLSENHPSVLMMQNLVQRSLYTPVLGAPPKQADVHYRLLHADEVALAQLSGGRVFDGQYFVFPKNSVIDVDIAFVVRGSSSVKYDYRLVQTSSYKQIFRKVGLAQPGQRVRLKYSYHAKDGLKLANCILKANLDSKSQKPDDTSLVFEAATLTVKPNTSRLTPGFEAILPNTDR